MTTAYRAPIPKTSAGFYRNAPHNPRAQTNPLPADNTPDSEKLLDRFAAKMRALHYSRSTEKVYRHWILQFLRFHRRGRQWRHPAEMGKTNRVEPDGVGCKVRRFVVHELCFLCFLMFNQTVVAASGRAVLLTVKIFAPFKDFVT